MGLPKYQPLTDYVELPEAEMLSRAEAYYEQIKKRHTVREFANRPVPRKLIENCILAAGTAPSGANLQPWHFAVIGQGPVRKDLRIAAEEEEKIFYEGRAGQEWLNALEPLGTDASKPFLEEAPWLIAIFGARYSLGHDGQRIKNYYVPESVGIATGFLVSALHQAGLVTLTHTPSPMGFLNKICGRPDNEKPYILLVAGYPAADAKVPTFAKEKKPLAEIATFL